MDRVKVCDLCLCENKLSMGSYTIKWNGFRLHTCSKHKEEAMAIKREVVLDVLLKAEQGYNKMILNP